MNISFLRSSIRVVIPRAAYLLGAQICLRRHVRTGSGGHGGAAAAPGQHRAHRRQPLHDGEALMCPRKRKRKKKKSPEEDTRVKRSLEADASGAYLMVCDHRWVFCQTCIAEACARGVTGLLHTHTHTHTHLHTHLLLNTDTDQACTLLHYLQACKHTLIPRACTHMDTCTHARHPPLPTHYPSDTQSFPPSLRHHLSLSLLSPCSPAMLL